MEKIKFEWDENKNKSNFQKHEINFEQACSVFNDPNILSIFDREHSKMEDRWISIGMNTELNILVVVHTARKDNTIRIISARKATKRESSTYFERKGQ